MTISRVASSKTTTSATSVSASAPAGIVAGDVVFAFLHGDTAAKSDVTNDGTSWTIHDANSASGSTATLFYRYVVTGEATSYSFRHSDSSSDAFSLTLVAYRGVDPTLPIDDWWDTTQVTSATLNIADSIQRHKNMMLLSVDFIGSNTTVLTPPAGYTLAESNTGFNPGCSVYELLQAAAGSIATTTFVLNASTTQKGWILPLRPGPTGPVLVAGPFSPDAAVNTDNAGGNAWSNPTNALTSNDSRASATVSGTTATDFLDVTLPAATRVPVGSTVVGVIAQIEAIRSGGTTGEVIDNRVQMILSGSAAGDNKAYTDATFGPYISSGDFRNSYGDQDDLWGNAITPALANASNIGLRVAVAGQAAGANRVGNIDHIRFWFYYRPPVGIGLTQSVLLARRRLVS